MDYPIDYFVEYCYNVCIEMEYRGYRCDFSRLDRYLETMDSVPLRNGEQIFPEWHNDIYLRECLYNLEEKFRAGGIPLTSGRGYTIGSRTLHRYGRESK